MIAYGAAINQALGNARTKLEDLKVLRDHASRSLNRKRSQGRAFQVGEGDQGARARHESGKNEKEIARGWARRELPRRKRDAGAESLRARTAQDRRLHVPVHVVWEITLACNLKCGHCGSRAGKRRANELSTAECLDVVRQLAAAGTREITLIGGEAYLRRDWLNRRRNRPAWDSLRGPDRRPRPDQGTDRRGLCRRRARHRRLGRWPARSPRFPARGRRQRRSGHPCYRRHPRHRHRARCQYPDQRPSLPQLPQIFDEIVAAGAKYWQVQLTVAMGNAVDNSAILLQPHQMIDVVDCLAGLYHRGRDLGLRLLPGNSIGYFGRHEPHWRSLTSEIEHWTGCTAGETTLGLEADGTIKGCPSLPKSHFAGGESRTTSIEQALENLAARTVRRDGNRGRSFCGSCYYWNSYRAAAPGYRTSWRASAATIPIATTARRRLPNAGCGRKS